MPLVRLKNALPQDVDLENGAGSRMPNRLDAKHSEGDVLFRE